MTRQQPVGEGRPMADGTGVTPDSTGSGQAPVDPSLVGQIQAEAAQARATAQASDPEDPGTGGINPRNAQAKMQHAQAAAAAATGAGFEFTPEQVEIQLKHCHEQLQDLSVDLVAAQRAEQAVYEPAPDAASVAQADAVREMMQSAVNVIRADIAYLTDWQNKLVAAKNAYMANEHVTAQQWQHLAQGLQA